MLLPPKGGLPAFPLKGNVPKYEGFIADYFNYCVYKSERCASRYGPYLLAGKCLTIVCIKN